MNRKEFLKLTGMSAGYAFFSDPLVGALATLSGKQIRISFHCEIFRPDDFLNLKFFFINLELNKSKSRLVRVNGSIPGYIVVKVPQLHRAEEVKDFGFNANCEIDFPSDPTLHYSEASISGYSYLSFELPLKQKTLLYTADNLLNWDNLDLLTISHLKDYPKSIPVELLGDKYPLDELNIPPGIGIAKIGDLFVPVTLFEVPYKMYLAPVHPQERTITGADYRYRFANKNNSNIYLKYKQNNVAYVLAEAWNNYLVFQFIHPESGVHLLPPHFKVVAYAYDPLENPSLHPAGNDRKNLAILTNVQEENRDVIADYFAISSFGASTFLRYYNLKEEIGGVNREIVNYKHEIKMGVDINVEGTEKALDVRSGFKLLYSRISERRVEKGKSPMVRRYFFKYLETEKTYEEGFKFNNYVFKKIEALSPGSFFFQVQLNADIPPDKSWIVADECSKVVLKFPYRGYESSGRQVIFSMDMTIIIKSYYNKVNLENVQRAISTRATNSVTFSDHVVRFNKEKISYAPEETIGMDIDSRKKNTELVTDEMQFYSTYNSDFEATHPIAPNLKYALVFIPQLEGIQEVEKPYYVNYAESYIKNGFGSANKTKVFIRTLSDTTPTKVLQAVSLDETVREFAKDFAKPIANVFSENYKNMGSLVNPDIVIENLSVLKQGISLTDEMNNRIDSVKNFSPADILRGLDAEILGGISLKKILKNYIPFDESPVFQVIEEATQVLEEFKVEIISIQNKVQSAQNKIKAAEAALKDHYNSALKSYTDKFIEKMSRVQQLALLSGLSEFGPQIQVGGKAIAVLLKEKRFDFEKTVKTAADGNTVLNTLKGKLDNFIANAKADIVEIIAYKQIFEYIDGQLNPKLLRTTLIGFDGSFVAAENLRVSQLVTIKAALNKALNQENYLNTKYRNIIGYYKVHLTINEDELKQHHEILSILWSGVLHEQVLKDKIALPPAISNFVYEPLKQLGALMDEAGITAGMEYQLSDDISSWGDLLSWNAEELRSFSVDLYTLGVNVSNEVMQESVAYLRKQKENLIREFEVLTSQVNSDVKRQFEAMGKEVKNNLFNSILVRDIYTNLQSVYLDFENIRRQAEFIQKTYGLDLNDFGNAYTFFIATLENEFKARIKEGIDAYKNQLPRPLKTKLEDLKAQVDGVALKDTQEVMKRFEDVDMLLKNQFNSFFYEVDETRQKILNQLNEHKKQVRRFEDQIKNFIKEKLRIAERELKASNQGLVDSYKKGEEAVKEAKKRVEEATVLYKKFTSLTKKEMNYTWNTNKFDDVNLGILKFVKGQQVPTRLDIDIRNSLHFSLGQFPPRLDRVESITNTRLSNFTLNFLNLISVEFDNISFQGGIGVKEKFDVAIRDVRFDGPLNFVQVFQSFLKTLDKGLRMDISAAGVSLGYEMLLPDISGGAFNFSNAKLVMDLRLPFKAKVPMRFTFGLNSYGDMFLVSAGIFGGRGCFQIALEPKKGLVMILLVIEFGGVLFLNIGVAKGIVFLFAGIYIRREYDQVELKGYIVCGGALDILGLITASVTFYLGMRGPGSYMEGYCTITYKIKIGAFITIKVGLSMYKRLYGSRDNSKVSEDNFQLTSHGFTGKNRGDKMDLDLDDGVMISDTEWDELFYAYYH